MLFIVIQEGNEVYAKEIPDTDGKSRPGLRRDMAAIVDAFKRYRRYHEKFDLKVGFGVCFFCSKFES